MFALNCVPVIGIWQVHTRPSVVIHTLWPELLVRPTTLELPVVGEVTVPCQTPGVVLFEPDELPLLFEPELELPVPPPPPPQAAMVRAAISEAITTEREDLMRDMVDPPSMKLGARISHGPSGRRTRVLVYSVRRCRKSNSGGSKAAAVSAPLTASDGARWTTSGRATLSAGV